MIVEPCSSRNLSTFISHQQIQLYADKLPQKIYIFFFFSSLSPPRRTSLFIVTSLVYAMLLIVVCVAYVISDVTTHRLPVIYYEGFFTYLYGASILFLLYVFCFLLQGGFGEF